MYLNNLLPSSSSKSGLQLWRSETRDRRQTERFLSQVSKKRKHLTIQTAKELALTHTHTHRHTQRLTQLVSCWSLLAQPPRHLLGSHLPPYPDLGLVTLLITQRRTDRGDHLLWHKHCKGKPNSYSEPTFKCQICNAWQIWFGGGGGGGGGGGVIHSVNHSVNTNYSWIVICGLLRQSRPWANAGATCSTEMSVLKSRKQTR